MYQHTDEMMPKGLNSLQLIPAFIDSKKVLLFGVEMILYSMCVASVTMSVASIIYSFVSLYKNRNNKKNL